MTRREALDAAVEAYGEAMSSRGAGFDVSAQEVDRLHAEVHRLLDEICPKEEEKNDAADTN